MHIRYLLVPILILSGCSDGNEEKASSQTSQEKSTPNHKTPNRNTPDSSGKDKSIKPDAEENGKPQELHVVIPPLAVPNIPDGPYSIIIPRDTLGMAEKYAEQLASGAKSAGEYLKAVLPEGGQKLTPLQLLGFLFDTKRPQLYAESQVSGNSSDWNQEELKLLGDVSVAVPVTIFDNGLRENPVVFESPQEGMLVFTPGALLQSASSQDPVDLSEVTNEDRSLDEERYYGLYRRRLLPVLLFINKKAENPRSALVTVPGLGCGQFAGVFSGQLQKVLTRVLKRLLNEYGDQLPNIKAVYYDPYINEDNHRTVIKEISLLVRPLTTEGNERKGQLSFPKDLQDEGDDFSNTKLFSIVAWDHVSWPGNEFFVDVRGTDDGTKAAATDSMLKLTGVPGQYNRSELKYKPPGQYSNWQTVVTEGRQKGEPRLWHDEYVWTP